MTIEEPVAAPVIVPETFAQQIAAHYACEFAVSSSLAKADHNFYRIVYVMIAAGLALIIGLAVMGIKMTHKVAGPLYKVTLYLAKVRDGRYDKVYDLRKGDQLVAFYEHFKHAHAGVVRLEQADVERIKAALAAVAASGAAERDPAVAQAVAALTETLARKEKSLGG
jgi:nitrogen fixation/metabolism regulation signal transduction histidine kinase